MNKIIEFAKTNNIPYTLTNGFSEFYYTAILFNTERIAWKIYKKMNMSCVGPIKINGKFGFRYF